MEDFDQRMAHTTKFELGDEIDHPISLLRSPGAQDRVQDLELGTTKASRSFTHQCNYFTQFLDF